MTESLKSFTQLNVWKEGHALVLLVYKLSEKFPNKEQFVLTSQILRAVISITSNIAEGFTRNTKKEKRQFYTISRGSLTELQNQLLIARDVGYLDKEEFEKVATQTVVVHKMLNALIASISQLPATNPKSL